jgi:hypothetical protein
LRLPKGETEVRQKLPFLFAVGLLTCNFHPFSALYSWRGAIELFTGAVKKISAEVAIPGRHGSDTNRALIERLEAYYKDL